MTFFHGFSFIGMYSNGAIETFNVFKGTGSYDNRDWEAPILGRPESWKSLEPKRLTLFGELGKCHKRPNACESRELLAVSPGVKRPVSLAFWFASKEGKGFPSSTREQVTSFSTHLPFLCLSGPWAPPLRDSCTDWGVDQTGPDRTILPLLGTYLSKDNFYSTQV